MSVSPDKIAAARDDLDAHVRAIVEWHFSPETGCPFWLSYAQQLDFDPREQDPLLRRLGPARPL